MTLSSINFIVAGNWNPKIFKPQWLVDKILQNKEMKINALFNLELIEIGYDLGSFLIFPTENYLRIDLKDKNIENIKKTTLVLLKILELLCHTPISALGFNIVITFDKNDDKINNKFSIFLKKYQEHDIEDFKIMEYKHVLKKENYQINIVSDLSNADKFVINFNFNYLDISKITNDSFVKNYEFFEEVIK